MDQFKNYRKVGVTPMRPYVEGEDLSGVSVSDEDTPGAGGMIAHDPKDPDDQWYVSTKYMKNYEPAETPARSFQQRVADEKQALDGNIVRLRAFFSTVTFRDLTVTDQVLLRSQMLPMLSYREVLRQRVERFGEGV